jgi:hypothetical protein
MSSNVRLTVETANAIANLLASLPDAGSSAGTILIYSGPLPATPSTAITTQTLFGTVTFSDPAFGSAVNGTIEANDLVSDAAADASGTPVFGRVKDSSGTTRYDLTCGIEGSSAALIMGSETVVQGIEIAIRTLRINVPTGV